MKSYQFSNTAIFIYENQYDFAVTFKKKSLIELINTFVTYFLFYSNLDIYFLFYLKNLNYSVSWVSSSETFSTIICSFCGSIVHFNIFPLLMSNNSLTTKGIDVLRLPPLCCILV